MRNIYIYFFFANVYNETKSEEMKRGLNTFRTQCKYRLIASGTIIVASSTASPLWLETGLFSPRKCIPFLLFLFVRCNYSSHLCKSLPKADVMAVLKLN